MENTFYLFDQAQIKIKSFFSCFIFRMTKFNLVSLLLLHRVVSEKDSRSKNALSFVTDALGCPHGMKLIRSGGPFDINTDCACQPQPHCQTDFIPFKDRNGCPGACQRIYADPPCLMENTHIHFLLEMSSHVKPFMISYYKELLEQFQLVFGTILSSNTLTFKISIVRGDENGNPIIIQIVNTTTIGSIVDIYSYYSVHSFHSRCLSDC